MTRLRLRRRWCDPPFKYKKKSGNYFNWKWLKSSQNLLKMMTGMFSFLEHFAAESAESVDSKLCQVKSGRATSTGWSRRERTVKNKLTVPGVFEVEKNVWHWSNISENWNCFICFHRIQVLLKSADASETISLERLVIQFSQSITVKKNHRRTSYLVNTFIWKSSTSTIQKHQ